MDTNGKEAYCPLIAKYCGNPEDCDTCYYMKNALEIEVKKNRVVRWLCSSCVEARLEWNKPQTVLPGFYTSGNCQNLLCQRDDTYSIVLQLVIFI